MHASDAHDVPPPPVPFAVEVFECESATVVVARGELDMATAPTLRRTLSGMSGALVLDLRHLGFVDVAGLRLLLQLESESRRDGLDLRLIPGVATERLLELAGVSDRFKLNPEAA